LGVLYKDERKMEKPVFDNLKTTKYDDKVELSKLASWAIWDKDDINNLEVIEKNIDQLNSKIVFVALNFSTEKQDWQNWQNFHCDSHADKRLRDLLSGTKYQGAYMTDLIKNYHEPNSDEAIKNFKKDGVKTNKDIDFLFKEIELLETENIEMYLFGEKVEWLFENYVMKHDNIKTFQQKVIKCQRIHHFSSQVTDFEAVASLQLGLDVSKKQIEKKWKYDPLW
jgi:hypothetical protein